MDNGTLKGFNISFQIYAHNEQEVEAARKAIVAFISQHAMQGRAVTAEKIEQAARNWDRNPIVRNQTIQYFT